jgi:type I restriction enzyme, S subunit
MQGDIPYWGAGGVLDYVDYPLFDESLVLLGEDGAPFFDPGKDVAYYIEGPAWVNNHIHVLRPTASDGRFLTYALNAVDYANYITGSTRDKLTQDDLKEILVPQPPLDEQRRIADFLDAETARIKTLVDRKASQEELLTERFDAELVHSLLHTRPPRWHPTRLRYLFEVTKNGVWGDDPAGDDTDVTCVRVADFLRNELRSDSDAATMRQVPASALRSRLLQPGDVLLEKSGGGEKSPVGFAVSFYSERRSVCSNFVAMLRPTREADARFVGLLMAAHYKGRQNIPYIKQTTGIQNLDGEEYLAQNVVTPNRSEQSAIAKALDDSLTYTLSARSVLKRQLALLAERRQALITAAVTGQFNVSSASGRGVTE